MNAKRVCVGTAIAALALAALPSTAQAASPQPLPRGEAGIQAADGKLHAWGDPYRGGGHCEWSGSSDNWGHTWWGCGDWASSIHNNGYPGNLDDVWVYKDAGRSGFRRGIHNGVYLADLGPFNFDGTNITLNNNISSHEWTNL